MKSQSLKTLGLLLLLSIALNAFADEAQSCPVLEGSYDCVHNEYDYPVTIEQEDLTFTIEGVNEKKLDFVADGTKRTQKSPDGREQLETISDCMDNTLKTTLRFIKIRDGAEITEETVATYLLKSDGELLVEAVKKVIIPKAFTEEPEDSVMQSKATLTCRKANTEE